MWPLRTILYFGVFWLGCIAALVNPIWGVANYMLAYQMNPPITWWGGPLVEIGMRFSLLAVIFTIIGLFTARKRVPDVRPIFCGWELCVLGLIALAVINIFAGIHYGASAQYGFEKFWKLQVFVLIMARLATTRANLRVVIWTMVIGSFYLGYDAFTAPQHAFLLGRLEAFGGPDISTSSGASAHLVAMLPILGIAFLITKSWRWKAFVVVSGALTFNAIVLCRTRSAFIGLLAGVLCAALMAPKARRFRIYALLVVGGICAFALTDANFWNRMSTLSSRERLEKDQAAVARMEIIKASVRMISDHPMGVGLGNFARNIGHYDARYRNRSPHNTLVMAFCEMGILGGVLFLIICGESVRLLYRSSRLAPRTEHPLETKLIAYGLLVALVSYFVAGLGTERFSCESFWWVLALPVCLHRLVTREVAARNEAPLPQPLLASPEGYPLWGRPRYGF